MIAASFCQSAVIANSFYQTQKQRVSQLVAFVRLQFELKNDFDSKAKKAMPILVLDNFAPAEQFLIDDFDVYKMP